MIHYWYSIMLCKQHGHVKQSQNSVTSATIQYHSPHRLSSPPQKVANSIDIREYHKDNAESKWHLVIGWVEESPRHKQKIEENSSLNDVDVLLPIGLGEEVYNEHHESSQTHKELYHGEIHTTILSYM